MNLTQKQMNKMYFIVNGSIIKEQAIQKIKYVFNTNDKVSIKWYDYYYPIYLLIKSNALRDWYYKKYILKIN
jgi:hypothetical protein